MKLTYTLLFLIITLSIFAQPINDDPCPNSANPPIDLTTILVHQGTTCEAIGYADDPNADYANIQCNTLSNENAVWYTFSTNSNIQGYQFEITTEQSVGLLSTEIFIGHAESGCNEDWIYYDADCNKNELSIKVSNCSNTNQVIWIKVASSELHCDQFTIKVSEEEKSCNSIETCDALNGPSLFPIAPQEFALNFECFTSCIDYTCPDLSDTICDLSNSPTIWFEIALDPNVGHMIVTVETPGRWTPIWQVYYGDNCDELNYLPNTSSVSKCYDNEVQQFSIHNQVKAYVSVSIDPNGIELDNPEINICAAIFNDIIVCGGNETDCDLDPQANFTVTDRSFENGVIDPDGDGTAGPFHPGETVDININFLYDATQTGADWLIGIIPDFGNGWELIDLAFGDFAPNGAEWIESPGECAAFVTEDFPHLCTYVDNEGRLRLCNALGCEYCPCINDPLQSGDLLPSGYFWTSTGGSAGCENTCSPSTQWGSGSTQTIIDLELQLRVKAYEEESPCIENNDLAISIQTFSDGGAGCWEDPVGECLTDKKLIGPKWKVKCNSVPKIISNALIYEIYSGETTDIKLSISNGSIIPIEISFDENPNITGAHPYQFLDGYGTIADTLINNTDTIQDLQYMAYINNVNNQTIQDSISILVHVIPCSIPGNDVAITIDQYTLNIEFNSTGYDSLLWDFGDGHTSTEHSPIHTYNESGIYTLELILYSPCSTDTISLEVIINPTGTKSNISDRSYELFPNPSSGAFIIKANSEETYNLTIYNINGLLIYESREKGTFHSINSNFDFNNLDIGLYFIEISNQNKTSIIKFIKN